MTRWSDVPYADPTAGAWIRLARSPITPPKPSVSPCTRLTWTTSLTRAGREPPGGEAAQRPRARDSLDLDPERVHVLLG